MLPLSPWDFDGLSSIRLCMYVYHTPWVFFFKINCYLWSMKSQFFFRKIIGKVYQKRWKSFASPTESENWGHILNKFFWCSRHRAATLYLAKSANNFRQRHEIWRKHHHSHVFWLSLSMKFLMKSLTKDINKKTRTTFDRFSRFDWFPIYIRATVNRSKTIIRSSHRSSVVCRSVIDLKTWSFLPAMHKQNCSLN